MKIKTTLVVLILIYGGEVRKQTALLPLGGERRKDKIFANGKNFPEPGLRKNFRKKILSVADSHPHRQLQLFQYQV